MTTTPQQKATETASAALVTVRAELSALDGWTIDNEEDNAIAGHALRDVKARHKTLEAERKKITQPLLEAKRAVDDLFREPRDLLERAERLLKSKIAAYLEEVEARNVAAFEAAADAETVDEAADALATVEQADAPDGVSVRYVWRARVINEDLLDRRFLVPDMIAIKAWAKEYTDGNGKPLAIPGVAFDREPIVSARS